MKKASIISVGNELLAGRIVDTNVGYLSRQLLSKGIPTISCYTVGDEINAVAKAISQAAEQADIVLITGGLGPTDDDLGWRDSCVVPLENPALAVYTTFW